MSIAEKLAQIELLITEIKNDIGVSECTLNKKSKPVKKWTDLKQGDFVLTCLDSNGVPAGKYEVCQTEALNNYLTVGLKNENENGWVNANFLIRNNALFYA